ncbi:DUF4352 domain-containing protein [Isoptericola cucumis]|uniref:DUF4352 domain-containing protein n=1 Tax=Isoptericola cucumis TaxID=1776856 RepID=A0ABQ2B5E0_9MICO|nr:DUF4352 domain-containing protein [Isoptericola cucumis]GGI08221.1 hypothetical protein GCM10007368_20080 [Isoptericola cucumis]
MTDQFPPPTPPTGPVTPEPASKADLKRQAREAKAVAKANRNWFARHKVLTGVGAVAAIGIVGSAMGGGGEEPPAPAAVADTTTTDAAAKAEPEKTAAIGDAVRDGKFEFTVTDVEDGVESVGDEYLSETAQGQYVLVHVTVENIGDESQMFYSGNQYAYDGKDREYSADDEAGIYLDDSEAFLNDINPGNKVEGVVVFDVPEKSGLTSIELHDSAFSDGVTVDLK